jgi:hypothetical protein
MSRKVFTPAKATRLEPHLYAAFISDLLKATITASALVDTRVGGRLDLKYDDPNS